MSTANEFQLIDRLTRWLPAPGKDVRLGVGDDTAVIDFGGRTLLAASDAMIETVHFHRDWISPEDLGWKCLAVNLSDVASMGGEPRFALITLGLPKGIPLEWADRLYRGLAEMSEAAGCPVIGGDTVASPSFVVIDVAIVGEAPEGRFVTRGGAKPGDVLCVTGTLGDSLAGYHCLRRGLRESDDAAIRSCIRSHHRPVPRLAAGRAALEAGGVGAMMDVSDGLSGDVRHIAERSGVGIRVFVERLPVSAVMRRASEAAGIDPVETALGGGEDYELLMAVRPDRVEAVRAAVEATGIALTEIGEATDRVGEITQVDAGGTESPLERLSWDHFREESG